MTLELRVIHLKYYHNLTITIAIFFSGIYGPLFRVGLFGQKMVVSTDPETNFSIFRNENQDLRLWHFGTLEEMVGEKTLASHGSIHRYLRNLVLRMVSSETLKVKLLHEMDVATQRHLRSCATDGRVHVIDAYQKEN